MTSTTWFERLTGFAEGDYESTRARLAIDGDELVSSVNGRRYGIGTLTLPTLAELRSRVKLSTGQRSSVETVTGDVATLHAAPEFEGATFQVASQFNVLEMTGPGVQPEDGVTRYAHDHTQGPACAIAAGAATIYRNYFVPVGGGTGQTHDRQIDTLAGLGAALSSHLGRPVSELWAMSNGYALCTSAGLVAITDLLASATDEQRDVLRGQLAFGLHHDVEVTGVDGAERRRVSQAFCSALPVAYSTVPLAAWESFARLVLEAAYEATLLAAVEQANAAGSRTVLLTRLGGGAFGNQSEWIDDAIWRALSIVEHAGLDVKLVDLRFNPTSRKIAVRWRDWPNNGLTTTRRTSHRDFEVHSRAGDVESARQEPDAVDNSPSWPHDEVVHAWWVEKGRLLAGEYPFSPNDPDHARRKVRALVDAGVDSFVDLTHPDDVNFMHPYTDMLREESEEAKRPQAHYRRFPIFDTKTISQEGYDEILTYIQGEIDTGRVVYVHCWGGKGRTSTVIGCRFIDRGFDYDATMAALSRLRAGTRKADESVPDTPAQHRVLRDRVVERQRHRTS